MTLAGTLTVEGRRWKYGEKVMAAKKAPRARIAANEADADELAGMSATGDTQASEDPEPTTGSVKKKV